MQELLSLAAEFFSKAAGVVKQQKEKQHTAKVPSTKKEKTRRQKSGYQLYLDNCIKEMKNNAETASKLNTGLTVPEISSIVSKRWREISQDVKNDWQSKARLQTPDISVQRPDVSKTLQQLIDEEPLKKRFCMEESASETESDSIPVKRIHKEEE